MKTYRVFDIIGPRMIGPSSSHTAGAARIGQVVGRLVGGDVAKAEVTLYESFATTGKGHGTDKAIAGGLLGFCQDDERLRDSLEIASKRDVDIKFVFSDEEAPHPNAARIAATGTNGETAEVLGASVGGGNIEILEINGMEVSFTCSYPTMVAIYTDVPGIIQMVSTVLMKNHINIAFMRVFRTSKSQDACMVVETDEKVPEGVINGIKACVPEIRRLSVI